MSDQGNEDNSRLFIQSPPSKKIREIHSPQSYEKTIREKPEEKKIIDNKKSIPTVIYRKNISNSPHKFKFISRNSSGKSNSKIHNYQIISIDAETQTDPSDILMAINLWKQYLITKSLQNNGIMTSHQFKSMISNSKYPSSLENLGTRINNTDRSLNLVQSIAQSKFQNTLNFTEKISHMINSAILPNLSSQNVINRERKKSLIQPSERQSLNNGVSIINQKKILSRIF